MVPTKLNECAGTGEEGELYMCPLSQETVGKKFPPPPPPPPHRASPCDHGGAGGFARGTTLRRNNNISIILPRRTYFSSFPFPWIFRLRFFFLFFFLRHSLLSSKVGIRKKLPQTLLGFCCPRDWTCGWGIFPLLISDFVQYWDCPLSSLSIDRFILFKLSSTDLCYVAGTSVFC